MTRTLRRAHLRTWLLLGPAILVLLAFAVATKRTSDPRAAATEAQP